MRILYEDYFMKKFNLNKAVLLFFSCVGTTFSIVETTSLMKKLFQQRVKEQQSMKTLLTKVRSEKATFIFALFKNNVVETVKQYKKQYDNGQISKIGLPS